MHIFAFVYKWDGIITAIGRRELVQGQQEDSAALWVSPTNVPCGSSDPCPGLNWLWAPITARTLSKSCSKCVNVADADADVDAGIDGDGSSTDSVLLAWACSTMTSDRQYIASSVHCIGSGLGVEGESRTVCMTVRTSDGVTHRICVSWPLMISRCSNHDSHSTNTGTKSNIQTLTSKM